MNSGEWRDPFDQKSTPTTSPDGLRSAEEMHFDKLAIFVGRPMYWTTNEFSSLDLAQRLMTLFAWCVSLPDVRLGIYPRGLAQILANVVATTPIPAPDGLAGLLDRYALSLEEPPPWPLDGRIWGPHLEKMIEMLSRVPMDEFIWVTPEEAEWWIVATAASIVEYGQYRIDSSALLSLLSRHHCTLFAPFDGAMLLDQLENLFQAVPAEEQRINREQLIDLDVTRQSLADSRLTGACWSWKLLEFGTVGTESIACLPQLALWSTWPVNRQWAPPRPASHPTSQVFSSKEAADYLYNVLWKKMETIFSVARNLCRLGLAEPSFGPRRSRPPLFYFASPVNPPVRPEGYAEQRATAIEPIIRRCLNVDDPFAESMAWGTIEGRLVTLRSARYLPDSYLLYYLLLPTGNHTQYPASAESEAGAAAESLGYLEFSISHEARDVGTDLETYQNRRALFGGSLDATSRLIEEAIEIFPMLSRRAGRYLSRTLQDLHLLMHEVQANAEKIHSDSVQLQGRYDNYVDSTDDYFLRRVTFSPLPHSQTNNLRVAVRQAYPYEYFRQPLQSHLKGIDEVRATLLSLISSLNSFIEQADLRAREQLSRVAGLLGVEIALLGLFVALPQLFNGSSSQTSTDFVDTFVGSLGIRIGVRDVAIGALILLVLTFLYFLLLVISHWFSPGLKILLGAPWSYRRHPWRFRRDLQHLREKVYQATQVDNRAEETSDGSGKSLFRRARMTPGAQLEQLDEEATRLLARMWGRLRYEYREFSEDPLKRWAQRERRLEYNLELFDLAPERIPLPRAICVFRFKSAEFRSYTMIADWQFEASLGSIGFSSLMSQYLRDWLSSPVNQRQIISEMDVTTFAQALKDHGVSADPDKRKPNLWRDEIKDAPHSS